eukprot:SAG22_NODE_96_length_20771_cov_33.186018_10_plen_332_part_00
MKEANDTRELGYMYLIVTTSSCSYSICSTPTTSLSAARSTSSKLSWWNSSARSALVAPDPSVAQGSAPAARSTATAPAWPFIAARCRGVSPLLSAADVSAPASSNAWMDGACPPDPAATSALPKTGGATTAMPTASSRLVTASQPPAAAAAKAAARPWSSRLSSASGSPQAAARAADAPASKTAMATSSESRRRPLPYVSKPPASSAAATTPRTVALNPLAPPGRAATATMICSGGRRAAPRPRLISESPGRQLAQGRRPRSSRPAVQEDSEEEEEEQQQQQQQVFGIEVLLAQRRREFFLSKLFCRIDFRNILIWNISIYVIINKYNKTT